MEVTPVTKYTKYGNNSTIKVHKQIPIVMKKLGFKFDRVSKTYTLERRLKHCRGGCFHLEIYDDGDWMIRITDTYGLTLHYQDILRDLVDSTLQEWKQALMISNDVASIMDSLSRAGIIEGYVKGQII